MDRLSEKGQALAATPFFPAAEAFTSLRQGVNNPHGFYCKDFNSPLFLPSSRRNQVCDSPAAIRLPEAL
jgi:hypothetical protein